MSLTKERKFEIFNNAYKLAFKAAEGGAAGNALELAGLIRTAYDTMVQIEEEITGA